MQSPPQQSRTTKVLALLFANGINLAIGFLMMPYLARSLSYAEYGSYGQVLLIGTLFTVVFGLGSAQAVNVIYAENSGEEGRVFSTNFWLFFASASVAALVLGLLSSPIATSLGNPDLGRLLLLYVPTLFFAVLGTVYTTSIVYFGRVRELAAATVTTNVLRIGLLVGAITYFESLPLAIAALGLVGFIQVVWYLRIIPSGVRSFRVFDRAAAKEQLGLSFPLLIVSLFGAGVVNADGLILSALLGVEEFAIYRAGAIEIPMLGTICMTVSTVLMPDIARFAADGNGKEVFALNRRASSVTAIAVIPLTILFIAFGEEFLTLYLSDKYAESGIVFSVYSMAVLIRITTYQAIPLAYKRSKAILAGFAAGLILNIAANLALIPVFGPKGAAAAYVMSQFFLAGYLIWLAARLTGETIAAFFDWRFLAMMAGLCLMLAASIRYIHAVYDGYLLLGLLSSIYMLAIFLFVWNIRPEQLETLKRILLRRSGPPPVEG